MTTLNLYDSTTTSRSNCLLVDSGGNWEETLVMRWREMTDDEYEENGCGERRRVQVCI